MLQYMADTNKLRVAIAELHGPSFGILAGGGLLFFFFFFLFYFIRAGDGHANDQKAKTTRRPLTTKGHVRRHQKQIHLKNNSNT